MEKKAAPYKGPGILVSRIGGWSPVRQTNKSAPEKRGVWAFIWPYFEPFLVGSTDHRGPTEHDRPSRMDLMKGNKRKDPSLALKKARYTGPLYTRMAVPGAELVGDWYLTDDQALKKYVFGKYPVEEWEGREQRRDREIAEYNSLMTDSYLEKTEKVAPFVKVGPRKPAKYNVSKRELEDSGQSPVPRTRDWNYAYRERMDEGDLPQPPELRVKNFTPLRKYTGLMSKDHFEVFIPAHGGKLTSVGPRMASDIMTLSETHDITDIVAARHTEVKEMKSTKTASQNSSNMARKAAAILSVKGVDDLQTSTNVSWGLLKDTRHRRSLFVEMLEKALKKAKTDFTVFGLTFRDKPIQVEFSHDYGDNCEDLFRRETEDFPEMGKCKVTVEVRVHPYADRIRQITEVAFNYDDEMLLRMSTYLQVSVKLEDVRNEEDVYEDYFEIEERADIGFPVKQSDLEQAEGRMASLKRIASQLDALEATLRKIQK